jgi:hypothetical protein
MRTYITQQGQEIRNPWARSSGRFDFRYLLGNFIPSRGLASSAYMPSADEYAKIRGKRPFFMPLNFNLPANGFMDTFGICLAEFYLLAATGTSTQGAGGQQGGFQFQLFDRDLQYKFSDKPGPVLQFAGSGQLPFIFRKMMRFEAGETIMARAQDLSGQANLAQVALLGFTSQRTGRAFNTPRPTISSATPTSFSDYPWIFPPPGMTPLEIEGSLALPAVGASGIVASYTVPPGQNGIIKRLAIEYDGSGWSQGDSSIYWSILQNGVPVPNYNKVIFSIGTVAEPSEIAGIRVYQNDLITVQISNVSLISPGAITNVRLTGWTYPLTEESSSAWF